MANTARHFPYNRDTTASPRKLATQFCSGVFNPVNCCGRGRALTVVNAANTAGIAMAMVVVVVVVACAGGGDSAAGG